MLQQLVCLPKDVDSRVWKDWPLGWEVHKIHAYTEEVAFASQDDDLDLGLAQGPCACRHKISHGFAVDGVGIFGSIELNQADCAIETEA